MVCQLYILYICILCNAVNDINVYIFMSFYCGRRKNEKVKNFICNVKLIGPRYGGYIYNVFQLLKKCTVLEYGYK